MTGFLVVFVVGSLKAAMKFAMKFYRAVRGIIFSVVSVGSKTIYRLFSKSYKYLAKFRCVFDSKKLPIRAKSYQMVTFFVFW